MHRPSLNKDHALSGLAFQRCCAILRIQGRLLWERFLLRKQGESLTLESWITKWITKELTMNWQWINKGVFFVRKPCFVGVGLAPRSKFFRGAPYTNAFVFAKRARKKYFLRLHLVFWLRFSETDPFLPPRACSEPSNPCDCWILASQAFKGIVLDFTLPCNRLPRVSLYYICIVK